MAINNWFDENGISKALRRNVIIVLMSVQFSAIIALFKMLETAKDLHRVELFNLAEKQNRVVIELLEKAQAIHTEVGVLKAENDELKRLLNTPKRRNR